MTDHHQLQHGSDGKILRAAAIAFALYGLIFWDYPPTALAMISAMITAVYVVVRLVNFMDNDRFSPKRIRVSLLWAILGISPGTDEYDTGPVLFYFSLLAVVFTGLILRPIIQWIAS